MEDIILIGGGGHCKSVIDSILNSNDYNIIGILDTLDNVGKVISTIEVIGIDNDLHKFFNEGITNAFITVGSTGNTDLRKKLFHEAKLIGYDFPVISDPSAVISSTSKIGKGSFIGKGAIVNCGTVVGENCIINSGSVIDHDCHIGDFCHIAPGAVLCGEVKVEEHVHIGANSVVKQQIVIEKNSIIGMGSVVINNISTNSVAFGNPCKLYHPESRGE